VVQLATLVSAIRSSPTVIWCLVLAQIAFVSCNHVSTNNVNTSTANVSVSPSPPNHASLKAKVEALENQQLGPSSLGSATPFETPNVTEIITAGEEAVPALVEAVKQENKPVLVAYAAYCLRRIKTDKGKDAALDSYRKYYKKRTRLRGEEPFAFNQLALYLNEISAIPDDMRPPGLTQ
jgi:hypothetical protein